MAPDYSNPFFADFFVLPPRFYPEVDCGARPPLNFLLEPVGFLMYDLAFTIVFLFFRFSLSSKQRPEE